LTSEDMRVTWITPEIAPTSWNASSAFKTSMLWDQQQMLSNMLSALVSTGCSQMVSSKTYPL
jgi:hypothetical protein